MLISDSDLQNVHPFIKYLFQEVKKTSAPSKIFSRVLGKIKQRPKHIGHYTRVSDTLQKKTLPKFKTSERDRHVQGSEDSGKPGNFGCNEKRGNKGMSTSPKSVCEHPVFSRQEGLENCPVIDLKELNKLLLYQPFKMASKFKRCSNKGLHVQIRHEGFLHFGSLTQKF